MTSFSIWIPGKATPQGSKKGFVINGRAVLVDASEGNKAWRAHVTQRIKEHEEYIRYKGPVHVTVAFYMEKAKTNKKTFMIQKPDIDKLCRSVMDAMTDAEIIEDDSRVVSLSAYKYWETDEMCPGVFIHIYQKEDDA
jgi:Holliday junction resolvase RusA-like endonuclease